MSLEWKIALSAVVIITGMISIVSWVRKKMREEDLKKRK